MDVELQQRSAVGCQLVTDVARSFGGVRLKVTGASMIPAIWPGDIITIRRSEIAELQPGQIVLYRREAKLVAHRVTCIHGDLLTTRGDARLQDDPPVNRSDVVGQVVCRLRDGRFFDLKQSLWQRVISSILGRSDFCMRIALRVRRRLLAWRAGSFHG